MKNQTSIQVREMVLQCTSQMINARASNVKSGWKTIFMVLTTASRDTDEQIVSVAYESASQIVEKCFLDITETDHSTFTDCINCFIGFANASHAPHVANKAIEFLKFCALQLANNATVLQDKESSISD